jgi:hypothetical protein
MLQIEYRTNFKSRSTLLFAGGASDVLRLLAVVRDWTGEEMELLQHLRQVEDSVSSQGVTSIKLSRAKAEKDSYLVWC